MNISGLHIEPTNICTLKCPGCARTQFIDKWPQHWHNHNIDINQLLKFLDIDLTGIRINLCGNYGDPIYHPDLIEFADKLKQQGAILSITTNGSYKKTDWWKNFVKVLTVNDTIVFSVDGTPENFTQYRVNADWNSIHEAMIVCASSSCKTKWKYIPCPPGCGGRASRCRGRRRGRRRCRTSARPAPAGRALPHGGCRTSWRSTSAPRWPGW